MSRCLKGRTAERRPIPLPTLYLWFVATINISDDSHVEVRGISADSEGSRRVPLFDEFRSHETLANILTQLLTAALTLPEPLARRWRPGQSG